ncbi:anti-sigma factor family protein [Marinicella sediminis]|uniref:Anti-sigma factor family protein n=1 Tax=Marinicella sediminis TaxID=1792834 RepID=A0ABV7J859_9GAMM|nr:hypothetical protein [Marinicella sediminis]
MNKCDHIKARLLDLDVSLPIRDATLKQHLEQCTDCAAYHAEWVALQQQLDQLPEHDVSDDVFARTLAAVNKNQVAKPQRRLNPGWATGLAASFVLVAVAGLLYNNQLGEFQADFSQAPIDGVNQSVEREEAETQNSPLVTFSADAAPEASADGFYRQRNQPIEEPASMSEKTAALAKEEQLVGDRDQDEDSSAERIVITGSRISRQDVAADLVEEEVEMPAVAVAPPLMDELQADHNSMTTASDSVVERLTKNNAHPDNVSADKALRRKPNSEALLEQLEVSRAASESPFTDDDKLDSAHKEQQQIPAGPVVEPAKPQPRLLQELGYEVPAELDRMGRENRLSAAAHMTEGKQAASASAFKPGSRGEIDRVKQKKDVSKKQVSGAGLPAPTGPDGSQRGLHAQAADAWLEQRQNTSGLSFKQATGYWANTYLPGDPQMRWIQAQLLASGLQDLPQPMDHLQPFDTPQNAPLALYVSSDLAAVDPVSTNGTRMRLQVGIQASEHQGGHRTALNLAVVLDISPQTSESAVRALLAALLKHKQPGDQISVYHTGPSGQQGSLLLKPVDFRHGPVQLMLNQLFSEPTDALQLFWPLEQVLPAAGAWLQQHDNPKAVLGSSALWLITDKDQQALPAMEYWVQQQATNGISFNTLSLSNDDPGRQLQRLALVGQGHHHVLAGITDADRVVQAQLKAASRAVARALRLQIRLADGVELIDVLGSHALNELQARQVRAAEQSLDQRMAANHGIQADRGEDDEGIQIIIPNFFAGDTHVIMLDVLVKQPGTVADVKLKYKDLIQLRNAQISQQFNLERGSRTMGQLERNVLKNHLAHHFAEAFTHAASLIRAGHTEQAIQQLQQLHDVYRGLRQRITGWQSDDELQADERVIEQYLALLRQQAMTNDGSAVWLAQALQLAGWYKHPGHGP